MQWQTAEKNGSPVASYFIERQRQDPWWTLDILKTGFGRVNQGPVCNSLYCRRKFVLVVVICPLGAGQGLVKEMHWGYGVMEWR